MSRSLGYFIYPRDKNGVKTGHCIAVVLREGLIFSGTSLCAKNDQFSKAIGRELALQRAEESYQKFIARKGTNELEILDSQSSSDAR